MMIQRNARILCLLMMICFGFRTKGQDSVFFSYGAFYELLKQNHPLIKQAALLPLMAKSGITAAKGNFDPTFSSEIANKTVDGQTIFQYVEPQIKVPTFPGIELKAGMDQSSGVLVNPEAAKYDAVTGSAKQVNYQLFYAGLSVPLLRGLLTDARRNDLKQAELLLQMNDAEKVKVVNKLIFEGAKAYWDWYLSCRRLVLMQQNLNLAENRLQLIQGRINGGEERPIDSTEAWMEWNRRAILMNEAVLEKENSTIKLSNYLWSTQNEPIQLTATTWPVLLPEQPQYISRDSVQSLLHAAETLHPEITKLQLKIRQQSLEQKLAAEQLKPRLNFEYYPFQTYSNGSKDAVQAVFTRNYKYGITASTSLFLRKERGKLKISALKVAESEWAYQQGKREMLSDVLQAYNELLTQEKTLSLQIQMLKAAKQLWESELIRFKEGESSLFLLNQRERSFVDAEVKLQEVRCKYEKTAAALQWAAGSKMGF